jgi:septal ring factor EnvC (AmiA/AmiB activator)
VALRRLIAVVVVVAVLGSITPLAKAEPQKIPGHELSAVREGLKSQSALASADEAKAAALLDEIRAIDARLLDAARSQEVLGDSEKRLEGDYASALASLQSSEKERAAAAGALESRLADIYKRGRLGRPRFVVEAATSKEPLRIARYLAAISQADSAALGRYDELRRSHERALRELDGKREEIDRTKAELAAENANYERARRQKTTLLAGIEKDLALRRSTHERLTVIEGQLQRIMVPDPAEDAARAEALARLNAESLRPFKERKGALTAPVTGKVRFRFGDRAERGAVVQGVVVSADGDRRVVTVAEGEVVFAGPFPGLGNTIILNHGDRYHTVYAHLSSIAHEVGQKVRQSEVIGTLAASDPMLHFELRSEGKAVDPVPWLAGGETAFAR